MKDKYASSSLVGEPDSFGWSGFFEIVPGLYVLIVLTSEIEDAYLPSLGTSALEKLKNSFAQGEDLDEFSRLKSSANQLFNFFLQKSVDCHFAAVWLSGDRVYGASFGGVGIRLVRGEKNVLLLGAKDEVSVVSGVGAAGDRFLMGSGEFFAGVEGQDVAKLMSQGVNTLVESMHPVLNSSTNKSKWGFGIIKFEDGAKAHQLRAQQSVGVRRKLAGRIDALIEKLPRGRVEVSERNFEFLGRRRLMRLPLVGVLILGVLLVSVFFGIRRREENEKLAQIQPKIEEIRHKYEEAKAINDLNQSRARQLVLSAQDEARLLIESGAETEELTSLYDEIEYGMSEIAGIYTPEATLYRDLSLVRNDFVGTDMSFSDGNLAVIDPKSERVVRVEVSSKNTEIVAGPDELFGGYLVGSYVDRTFVLAPDGVREVDGSVELLVRAEDWDARDSLFRLFAGNIYVLDKGDGRIMRYPAIAQGYGVGQEWFGAGIEPDLEDTLDWAIDGSIYILKTDNTLKKYLRGAPERFSLDGFDPKGEVISIFTYDEAEYLYLLEPEGSRVVVTSKDGGYVAEYLVDGLSEARDFVVDEASGIVIYLSGSKLYSFELKHR